MKRLQVMIVGCVLFAFAAASLGCNTMKGVGRDVEEGGERIQDVAE